MNSRISIQTEHGTLYGQLVLPPAARGLVLLAHAGTHPVLHPTSLHNAEDEYEGGNLNSYPNSYPNSQQKAHDEALAVIFQHAGLASLTIDLLAHREDRYPDAHNNVPLLTKRLLDCLVLAKRQLWNEELTDFPIGLCGAGPTSPAVLRVAALRDHDICAVVCRGGLIDQAGMLYLRSLEAPILLLVGEADRHLVAASRRALQEVACRKALTLIPDSDSDFASTAAFELLAHESAQWFVQHFPPSPAKIKAASTHPS